MKEHELLLFGYILLAVFTIIMMIILTILYALKEVREKGLISKLFVHCYLGPVGYFIKERKNKKIKYAASSVSTVAYILLLTCISMSYFL